MYGDIKKVAACHMKQFKLIERGKIIITAIKECDISIANNHTDTQ